MGFFFLIPPVIELGEFVHQSFVLFLIFLALGKLEVGLNAQLGIWFLFEIFQNCHFGTI